MANSTGLMPTTVAPKTAVGSTIEREIRDKVAATLVRFPTKSVEAEGDLTDEGVRLLKNGKRTISTATLVKLARSKKEIGPAVWAILCELCGRGGEDQYDSPRLNSLVGALHVIAKSNGPVGDFAAAMVREMNQGVARPRDSEADANTARASFRIVPNPNPYDEPSHYTPDGALGDLLERRRA